ncbi:uncharacterized protein LOC116929354 [Daphnia magna]|uniref:uncharacterized protein LOC116929354 n=1 Tax=Daphnia magna TaxID=35525 RepID=UPI001E1BB594|nr:uncharacterized protein LOC116929354 [Daphnia magna]
MSDKAIPVRVALPLEAIQEEEPEEELEEWQTTNDPAELKHYRTQAKRIHTKSLNQALLAVRMLEDVDTVNVYRVGLVRAYDIVERIHRRYVEALADVANYLDSCQARARSVAGSRRSSTSNRSSASSTRRKLQEAERLEKEMQLKIQQERAEALQQAEEDERMQQLEIARKAEERRVEAARKEHYKWSWRNNATLAPCYANISQTI